MAIDFNGTTDRIDWPAAFDPEAQAYSISVWVYADAEVTDIRYIWAAYTAGDAGFGHVFFIDATDSVVFYKNAPPTSVWRRANDNTFTPNQWEHLILTGDGSLTGPNHHIYINGSEPGYKQTNSGGEDVGCSGSWSMGGRIYDDTRNFNGKFAAPGIWNRVLSAEEIASLADGFSPRFILNGLKFAPDLIRGINDPVSGGAGTADGTTVYPHPRIFHPAVFWMGRESVSNDLSINVHDCQSIRDKLA